MTTNVPPNVNQEVFNRRFRDQEPLDYSNLSGRPGRRDRQVMRWLRGFGVRDRRCLDVGPGTGRWLQFLKDNGAADLTAIDVSEEALDRAAAVGAEGHKLDVESQVFPFEEDSFDIVLSFMVLEHLRVPDLFVQEVLRVARPSALILMTIPNIASFQSRVRLLFGYLPVAVSQDPTHVKFYTMRELTRLFGARNATVEQIPTSFSLHPFNRGRLRLPSNRILAGLDDHRLFRVRHGT